MLDQSPGIAARMRANIRLTSKQQSGFPTGPRPTHPFGVRFRRALPDEESGAVTGTFDMERSQGLAETGEVGRYLYFQ